MTLDDAVALPPVGFRGLAIRAALQGSQAYAAGAPLNACPYGDPRPFTRRAWVAGYVQAARDAGARLPGDVEAYVDESAPWPNETTATA